jgi:hypothetical protein
MKTLEKIIKNIGIQMKQKIVQKAKNKKHNKY